LNALVAFTDRSDHRLAHWLRPGFRHVAVAIQDSTTGVWVLIDASKGLPIIRTIAADEDSARAALNAGGYDMIIRARQRTVAPPWPITMASCTGMVKAVLGINAPLTLTPFRLYLYLLKQKDAGA